MRVVLLVTSISSQGGGVAEVVRLTAQKLREEDGVSVEVVTLKDSGTEEASGLYDVPVHVARSSPPHRLAFSPGLLKTLLRIAPDVVHVHGIWQLHVIPVLLWSYLTKRPYVVSPHGMLDPWILKRSPRLKTIFSYLFHNRFLRRAAGFQALTVSEKESIARILPHSVQRLIPNYVSLDVGAGSLGRPNWWRPEFDARRIFLFFGRIHEKKGCMELIRAWDAACEVDEAFRRNNVLVFCGWNDGLPEFDVALADIAGRQGNAFFGGAQFGRERSSTLSSADFLILPSHSEGLPMAILEAWACGTPSMMTAACNLPSGFAAGAAIEIAVEVEALAKALLAAADISPLRLEEMGESAMRLVSREYSPERVVAGLMDFYRDVGGAATNENASATAIGTL